MSCTIKYNEKKEIQNVFTPEGVESRLFRQIARIPHVNNFDEALSIFKNVYTDSSLEEESLVFRSDKGNNFDSYAKALKDSTSGDIEIGVLGEEGFKNFLTVSSNTNPSTYGGLINNWIKSNVLSDQKIIENGKTYHKAAGVHGPLQIANEQIIKEDAKIHLGRKNFTLHRDGRLELRDEKGKVQVGDKLLSIEEIRGSSLRELEKKVGKEDAKELVINNIVSQAMPAGINPENLTQNEEQLKLNLLDLLNNMGVTVTSIENYVDRYKSVNGVDPSAKALVDIANQVIAFKDGHITLDALAEETVHFIVETWDNAEIENLVRNAHKTESYAEFSEQYREIYTKENPNMSEEEIETLVRKEVLGKELAKSLRDRLSMEGKTEVQQNILTRLVDMLRNFFNNLIVKDNFYSNLEDLAVKVEDLLLTKDVNNYLNLNQAKSKKFRMYQTHISGDISIDTKNKTLKDLMAVLLEQEKNMKRAGSGSISNIRMLNESMDKFLKKSSILDLLSLAKRQSEYVESAIERAKQRGETLSNEEGIVLHGLQKQIMPVLNKLLAYASQKDSDLKDIKEDIAKITSRINAVDGKVTITENAILDRLVERLSARGGIPNEEEKARVKEALDGALSDTQTFFAVFGQITHANDPLLNMLGSVIADMHMQAERSFQNRARKFQSRIKELGFTEKDLSKFSSSNGYLMSVYDFDKFDKDIIDLKLAAYKKYSGTQMSDEDIIKGIKTNNLPRIEDEVAEQAYYRDVNEQTNDKIERSFTKEFYDQREQRYEKLGISETTKRELRALSGDMGVLMSRVKTEKGLPRYTIQDKYDLDGLNIKRKKLKSFYDSLGNVKAGIVFADKMGPNTIEIGGLFVELDSNPSEEAIVAFEMSKLDQEFLKEKQAEALVSGTKIDTEKLAPKFLEELSRIEREEGREAAVEFFLLNSTVGFSNEFWNNFDTTSEVALAMDEYLADPNSEEIWKERIKHYRENIQTRKAILKQYQDSRNFTNTMVEEMTDKQRAELIRLSEEIDSAFYELSSILRKDNFLEGEIEEPTTETTPNQAYYDALSDADITSKDKMIEFAISNMTRDNARKVRKFSDELEGALRGRAVSNSVSEAFERLTGSSIDSVTLSRELVDNVKLQHAENKLAVYYKAFAPIGLRDFYNTLKNSNSSVSGLVSNLSERQDVKVSNNFSYYEIGEVKYKNPNYREDFEGGPKQPKLSKYLSKEFVDTFNPVLDSNNIPVLDADGNIQATKNQKLFELYKELINFQKDTLRSYGELGTHNIYLAPQTSKSKWEKSMDLLGKKDKLQTASNWINDIVRFRVDEQAFGEEVGGAPLIASSEVRIVPKYFLKRLEESSDVSTDIFYSTTLMAQQAELYKARKDKYSEFSTLNDKVLSRSYPGGKAATSTNTYKMFKSYIDYNLFGVTEVRSWRVTLPFVGQVDMVKIINWLHNWVRNNSLARNVIVPVTSWLTAEASLLVEKYVGQYIDPSSYKLAGQELRKLSTDAMKEGLEINSKAKLSIIGEHYKIFNLSARFENSKYSKASRTLAKSSYILHTAGNFVPLSRAMLSQLYGNRIYEGKFYDFNAFSQMYKKVHPDANTKDVGNAWESIKDKSIYRYINTSEEGLSYDYDALAKDMNKVNDESFREDFSNVEYQISNKIKKVVERVDGQISDEERTTLQRDVLGRFVMTHKGWLAISAANRFKKKHLNLQTGQVEEGTYYTLFNFIAKNINEGIKKGGMKGIYTEFKEAFKNADPTTAVNLKRILVDFLFLTTLYLVTLGLSKWADDDEDNWTAQFTAYMFERLQNETASSQFGVMGEFYNGIKEPLVGVSKLENLSAIGDLFDSSIVSRGRYAGLSKRQEYIIKNLVGAKPTFDIWSAKNLNSQRHSYDFFNKEEITIPMSWLIDQQDLDNW